MKKIFALVLALALLFSASAVAQEDPVLATAWDGAVTLTQSEFQEEYDQMLSAYVSYYSQYGYAVDEYDVDFQASIAPNIVGSRMQQLAVVHYIEEQGYTLSDEARAEIEEMVKQTAEEARAYYETYLSQYGLSGEELEAAVDQELAASGYDEASLLSSMLLNGELEYLYTLVNGDTTISEDEVKAAFAAKVAAAKENYASVDAFINDYLNGAELLYTPAGLRVIQAIYIAPEQQTDEGEAEAEEAPVLAGMAKAEEAAAKIAEGMSFTEAMSIYNEDGAALEDLQRGYPISAESEMFGEEFLNAALALEKIGDVSGIVTTDYGYFIMTYAFDLEENEAQLDESRMASETDEALEAKKNEIFSAAVEAAITASNIQMNDLSCLYHVYVGETAEATVAYASVSEETALYDMPAGDAVATLSAGATLDVLGSFLSGDEAYSFCAVPGTAFKGYVKSAALEPMDAEAALAVDNGALTAACEMPEKNPTFSIVMNDGSVVYGELYPESAPESVGNFAALAGEGYYDGLTFHRVIAGFVIQGGAPLGVNGPGYAIKGEFSANGVENPLSHTRGVLSMARSSAPDSAGGQFFICHADCTHLDGQYAAFGMVLGGMDTVDVIASVPTDANDKPRTEQTMRTVYVETYGKTYAFTKLSD